MSAVAYHRSSEARAIGEPHNSRYQDAHEVFENGRWRDEYAVAAENRFPSIKRYCDVVCAKRL